MERNNSYVGNGPKVDLFLGHFLGAGTFGRVFLCDAFFHDVFLGVLVVKLALSQKEHRFDVEETAYNGLRCLYDNTIPHFYGHFTGDFEGAQYSALLLSDCGESVNSLFTLTVSERYVAAILHPATIICSTELSVITRRSELVEAFWRIHRQGVVHGDISQTNILRSSKGLRIMDNFSCGHRTRMPGRGRLCRTYSSDKPLEVNCRQV